MTLDLRFELRPDGLYRRCLVCGQPFKIESTCRIAYQVYKDGVRYVKRVEFSDRHPRNLLQMQCPACPPVRGSEGATTGKRRDTRASLRASGMESWKDYNG